MQLPDFVYLYLVTDIYDRHNRKQFSRGDVIEALRHPSGIGWASRENIVTIYHGQAYEPEPGDRNYGAVENYIYQEWNKESTDGLS